MLKLKYSYVPYFFFALFFIACTEKTELSEEIAAENNQFEFDLNSEVDLCGTVMEVPLCAGQNNTYGSVTIGNDEDNLYVSYTSLSEPMIDLHLWVGDSWENAPGNNNPAPGQFPYKKENCNCLEYTFTIPLADLNTDSEGCFDIIAHVAFGDDETGYGSNACPVEDGPWNNWAQYVEYCPQECNDPNCDTGFAYLEGSSLCFLDDPNIQGNRWGWVIGPLSPGEYEIPVYAGAGQCDLNNGYNAGTTTVSYDGTTASVIFDMDPNYDFTEWHFNVSCEQTPETTAPGQYNCNDGECDIDCPDGLYVIVHTVTCQ